MISCCLNCETRFLNLLSCVGEQLAKTFALLTGNQKQSLAHVLSASLARALHGGSD